MHGIFIEKIPIKSFNMIHCGGTNKFKHKKWLWSEVVFYWFIETNRWTLNICICICICGQIDARKRSIEFNIKLVLLWPVISLTIWELDESMWQFAEIIIWFSTRFGRFVRPSLSWVRYNFFIKIYHNHHQFFFMPIAWLLC